MYGSDIMYPSFAFFAVLTTIVFGGANQSTQTPPFGDEITPATGDPCTSSPCVTGDCINLGNGQFKCSCIEGWYGSLCNTGFRCGLDKTACLPFSTICNDTNECSDYFDESNCCRDDNSNKIQEFSCTDQCVSLDKLCDGQADCDNVYDEFYYCRYPCTITVPTKISTSTDTAVSMLMTIAVHKTPISSVVVPQNSTETYFTANYFTQTSDVTYGMTPTTKPSTETHDITYCMTPATKPSTQTSGTTHGMTSVTKHITQKGETIYGMTIKFSSQLSEVTNSAMPTMSSPQANKTTNEFIPSTTPSIQASDTIYGITLTESPSIQTNETTYSMKQTTKPSSLQTPPSDITYGWTTTTDTTANISDLVAYGMTLTTKPSNQTSDILYSVTPTTMLSTQNSENIYGMTTSEPSSFSPADSGDEENRFSDETNKIVGITASLGGLAAGGTTIALAARFCKKQSMEVKSAN